MIVKSINARSTLTTTKMLAGCLLVLNLLSLLSLYSSLHLAGEFKSGAILYRQIVWVVASWIFLIIFAIINYRLYYDFGYIFYGFNILLLIAVFAFGSKAMGAQRWINFIGFKFQPSELCKIAAIFVFARLFSGDRRGPLLQFLLPLGLASLMALLIFKQPDLGTSLIIVFLFFAIGISSKVSKRYFIALILAGLIAAPFAWGMLKNYQRKRLVVFVNPDVDPLGAGYTIIQSKIAIGSGRIFGKGFLSGTQNQFNFLPERHTDFIFTVVAEEWGFVGGLFLLIVYWLILYNILNIARSAKDDFARLLALGIGSLFFLHIFINIGMTLGILPVVGLPLIFMSYGGSNLLINFVLMGILINISRQA
ncbi:MAG: rod shape-determining protein RodA [Candidatus Omnitrophica bacterium]|nr:rod shape-determining protein RodA [Candidatus Omnitrophota bacterium]